MSNGKRLAVLVVFMILSYSLGFYVKSAKERGCVDGHPPGLTLDGKQSQALSEIRQQLANTLVAAEVDRLALETMRSDMVVMSSELDRLREENRFYKRLMKPEEGGSVLAIHSMRLFVVDETSGVYRMEMLVQQTALKHKLVEGDLRIEVEGFLHQEPQTLKFEDLVSNFDGLPKLHFRYFQTLSSLITLPEGFSPVNVHIAIRQGKNEYEQTFFWQVEKQA
ncbi:MAG: hypothetical protein KDI30_06600 [Pseudomonadales bacterium]|nr:hypothetical protein [Pseudomonadales bacterium]